MIRVESLSKSFAATEALRPIGFEVPPGQVCGYLGPNGAGKTTTVRILTGVLRPSDGRAEVAGFDVCEEPLEVKRRIGYVPETGAVYSTLSVSEYLALVGALHEMEPEEVGERSARMLGLFGIAETADRRLDTLSKGMRQKVVIAAGSSETLEAVFRELTHGGDHEQIARALIDTVHTQSEPGGGKSPGNGPTDASKRSKRKRRRRRKR